MKRNFFKLTTFLFASLIISNTANADYKTGRVLHNKQQYSEALAEFKQGNKEGELASQYMLGIYYSSGLGVKVNHDIAKSWYQKAAEQGYKYAQNNLGNYLSTGLGGTELDYDLAIYWYEKAAAQNDIEANYNLGQMYEFGFGYAVNITRAVELYEIAAAQSHADAQYRLAIIYAYGKGGLIKDYKKAEHWIQQAVDNGHEEATKTLRELVSMGLIKGK